MNQKGVKKLIIDFNLFHSPRKREMDLEISDHDTDDTITYAQIMVMAQKRLENQSNDGHRSLRPKDYEINLRTKVSYGTYAQLIVKQNIINDLINWMKICHEMIGSHLERPGWKILHRDAESYWGVSLEILKSRFEAWKGVISLEAENNLPPICFELLKCNLIYQGQYDIKDKSNILPEYLLGLDHLYWELMYTFDLYRHRQLNNGLSHQEFLTQFCPKYRGIFIEITLIKKQICSLIF